MKTETWKPQNTEETKNGLYADEIITFYAKDMSTSQRLPVAAALLLALDFIATSRAFSIEDEHLKTWLSFDGQDVQGPESLQMALSDMAPLVDAMFNHHFSQRLNAIWENGQAQLAAQEAEEVAVATAEQLASPSPEPSEIPEPLESFEPSEGLILRKDA